MGYDKELPGCFGSSDLIFAAHPADQSRAFDWLALLRVRGIGWDAAKGQIEVFLKSKGADQTHIADQIKAASAFLKPWLLD